VCSGGRRAARPGTQRSSGSATRNVDAGSVIGSVGRTSNAASTPPHLHREIHPGGRSTPAIDPTPTAERLYAANTS
jgi:murein DD-endopeptidase MepM/ murein hydrolase activator NlpD